MKRRRLYPHSSSHLEQGRVLQIEFLHKINKTSFLIKDLWGNFVAIEVKKHGKNMTSLTNKKIEKW
jgi:hypothetical protein